MTLDLDSDGQVILNPLVGFSVGTPFGTSCLLRAEYLSDPEQPETQPHALQLVCSPAQARHLAEALMRAAAKCEQSPGPDTAAN